MQGRSELAMTREAKQIGTPGEGWINLPFGPSLSSYLIRKSYYGELGSHSFWKEW